MKLLITGASGFVGGALWRTARAAGHEVIAIGRRDLRDRDYTPHDLTRELVLEATPDVVVHAAARSSPWGSPGEFTAQNVIATRNVVRFCETHGRPLLVHISTSAVMYANEHQLGMDEETPLPAKPINLYAATKREAEATVRSYSGPSCIVRPRAVFGPGDTVVFPRILRAARQGRLPLIESNQPVVGDLIYIDNFRSAPRIISVLNSMRPALPQQARDPAAEGSVAVYHTNQWPQARLTGQHWAGDLPPENVREAAARMKTHLVAAGWDLEHGQTKILMLTHRALAGEQGYGTLAGAFTYNESYIKKEDAHIAFFADKLEPACAAYSAHRFGDMFTYLGADSASITKPSEKASWKQEMESLLELRLTHTIGEVLNHLKAASHIPFPDSLRKIDQELGVLGDQPVEDEPSACTRLRNMRPVPYREVTALVQFIEGHTPFETKHGVKGAEFENVLVMLGRGWNQYNFGQFLEWHGAPPADKKEAYERNRNLFYVVCSRPKQRLALLFTQQLNAGALATLNEWFGPEAVQPLPP